jgi:hypothetical protein
MDNVTWWDVGIIVALWLMAFFLQDTRNKLFKLIKENPQK